MMTQVNNFFLGNERKNQLIRQVNEYEMKMFKCVTMAKCGNIILIDDKFNKVTALSAIDFSIIYQRIL
jgi:hypothetical protein